MKDYITLRKQYTDFIYHGWEIDETDTSFTITYAFEIVGLQSFHPTLHCRNHTIIHRICRQGFSMRQFFHLAWWS